MKDGEPETDKEGPIVIEPAWTGSDQDHVDPLTIRSFHQSPVRAIGRLLLQGSAFCLAAWITLQFVLHALQGMPRRISSVLQGDAGFEFEYLVALAGCVLVVAGFLYALRWFLRELIVPVWRGGFSGQACIVLSEDGFIDHRILHDPVPWEHVESIECHKNRKLPDKIVISLKHPCRQRDDFLGKRNARQVSIWDGILIPEDLLATLIAHRHAWKVRKKRYELRVAKSGASQNNADRDPSALRRDNE
ncbi:MAG: hypothetical protein Kow00114_09360 [Kiloniellaceae bacterium]